MAGLFAVNSPKRNENTRSSLLSRGKAQFLKFSLAQEAPVATLQNYLVADSAALTEMAKVAFKECWSYFGKDGINRDGIPPLRLSPNH
jgi:hypothetical protein